MSHEIMENDIQEGRRMAWHNLTKVNENLTLDNCDMRRWDYIARPCMVEEIQPDGSIVLVKTGMNMLGCTDIPGFYIGDSYNPKSFKPLFNARLLDECKRVTEGTGLVLESCGTIKNRGRQFLSFSLEAAKFQVGNRPFNAYLNIGNGNDQSSPIWTNTSNTCTVCNNTFTINMDGDVMRVKKTQNSDLKITELGAAISEMLKEQAKFAKGFRMLDETECNEENARLFFIGFIGTPGEALNTRASGNVDDLLRLFKDNTKGNNGKTFADVFSAITDFYTHEAASGKGDQAALWKNYLSSEFGSGKIAKAKAWDILTSRDKSNQYGLRRGMIALGAAIDKVPAKV